MGRLDWKFVSFLSFFFCRGGEGGGHVFSEHFLVSGIG